MVKFIYKKIEKEIPMKKKGYLFGGILFIVLIIGVFYLMNHKSDEEKVSRDFAKQLYEYPLPNHSKIIQKSQVNGQKFVPGNGGYWGVIASVTVETTLPEKEIIAYYQHVPLFNYPKSDKRGVQAELYLEGNYKKIDTPNGYYYESKKEGRIMANSYERSSASDKSSDSHKWTYVVQLTSDFE